MFPNVDFNGKTLPTDLKIPSTRGHEPTPWRTRPRLSRTLRRRFPYAQGESRMSGYGVNVTASKCTVPEVPGR